MHHLRATSFLLALTLGISSCVSTRVASDGDELHLTPNVNLTHTLTPTSLQSLEVPATATSLPKSEILWARYQSSGDRIFILGEEQLSTRRLPVSMGAFYGYNSQKNEIFMALEFPDRGAGPGGVSVSDLSILNLESGAVEVLLEDDVVKARWSPVGDALAYILATDSTYELHWRTQDGVDRTVAYDVSFTWSIAPSGRAVAFTRETGYELDIKPGLYVVDLDTGAEKLIADVDKRGTGSITDQPYWSPDSREVILSHWGGPDQPRLILAKADGGGSFDFILDKRLSAEWWATIALTDILWDVDGLHLLALSSMASKQMGGPGPLVYYRLDRTSHSLVEGILLAEVNALIGWAIPGKTVWVLSPGGDGTQVALP